VDLTIGIALVCSTETGRNEALVFTAVVEPQLLTYSSDSTCRIDVVVRKSFALSSKTSERNIE